MILSVIILVYHDEEYLKKCVSSLRESAKEAKVKLQIIIVVNDNKLKRSNFIFPDNCTIIFNKQNLGFGKSINLASKKAKGEWLGIINIDTVTKKSSLRELHKHINDRTVGIIAPKLLNPDGSLQFSIQDYPSLWNLFKEQSYLYKILPSIFTSKRINRSQYKYTHEVEIIEAVYILVKRELFKKVNGFDESYFIYFDDYNFCMKVKNRQFKIILEPESEVIHFGHKSFGGVIRGDYYLKSLYKFLEKYHSRYYTFCCALIVIIGSLMRLFYWFVKIRLSNDKEIILYGRTKLVFCKMLLRSLFIYNLEI